MFCTKCGKQINDEAVVCVNCGAPTKNFNLIKENKAVPERKLNVFGIVGFSLGIHGIFISIMSLWIPSYFCVFTVIALALSIVGMTQLKKSKANGLTVAGFVLNVISAVFWSFTWITILAGISI